jgi:hypothetical protein
MEEESFQSLDESEMLVSLCSRFPNLKSIIKCGDEPFTNFAAKYGVLDPLGAGPSRFRQSSP